MCKVVYAHHPDTSGIDGGQERLDETRKEELDPEVPDDQKQGKGHDKSSICVSEQLDLTAFLSIVESRLRQV